MMRLPSLGAIAILAACGKPGPAPADDAANAAVEVAVDDGVAQANAIPPFAEVPGAHPTAPVPAPIPAKFRGVWADSKAKCGDLADLDSLVISGNTLRHHDFVIVGDSVSIPAADQFALKGHIEATGARAEAHYAINAGGDRLTDGAGGGTIRVRCS